MSSKEKEIPLIVEELRKEVTALDEAIIITEQTFAGLVSVESPQSVEVSEIGRQAKCELGDQLLTVVSQVTGLRLKLLSLTDRSQI